MPEPKARRSKNRCARFPLFFFFFFFFLAVLHHGKTAGDVGAEPPADPATDIATPAGTTLRRPRHHRDRRPRQATIVQSMCGEAIEASRVSSLRHGSDEMEHVHPSG